MADEPAPDQPVDTTDEAPDLTSYTEPDLTGLDGEQRKLFEKLTAPFRADEIEILPKPYKGAENGNCKVCKGFHGLPAAHLSYVGHAGITMRLIEVDPTWSWEPLHPDIDDRAFAATIQAGNVEVLDWLAKHSPPLIENGGIWIRLHVAGMTAVGFGDADGRTGAPKDVKEMIGDAIRNAAMRLGVGTYLWSKSDKAKALVEQHGGDDTRPTQTEQPKRKGSPPRRVEQTDPWKVTPLDADGRGLLRDLLVCDDPDTSRGLWREVRALPTQQTVTVKDLGAKHAAVLEVAGPLTLLEVATKVGIHLQETGISVKEDVEAQAGPGPDQPAATDEKVQKLRDAARGGNGGAR